MPRVSVVIPTHNRAAYIRQALDSVFVQTYSDYEVIVVDDGSTDGTQALLKPLADKGSIRYVKQPARGVSVARNRGVGMAKGEYVAFLDSDDLFEPAKLERQVALYDQHPELGLVHCHYRKFDDHGHDLGLRDTSQYRGNIYPQLLMQWDTLMATPCMLMRKSVIEEVGGYDESMRWGEDLDLWRRIAQRYPADLVPEALARIRVHPAGISQQRFNALPGFERYLAKAFADDPDLPLTFKRRAYAQMYSHFALTMLGEGAAPEMRLVRRLSMRSLSFQPLRLNSLLVWLASFIPRTIRMRMLAMIRHQRYSIQ